MQLQKLGEHNQYDQSPEILPINKNYPHSLLHWGDSSSKSDNLMTQHTISTLLSSFSGSEETRQRNTAHARISGPASFFSKTLRLDTRASIS